MNVKLVTCLYDILSLRSYSLEEALKQCNGCLLYTSTPTPRPASKRFKASSPKVSTLRSVSFPKSNFVLQMCIRDSVYSTFTNKVRCCEHFAEGFCYYSITSQLKLVTL